MRRISRRRFLQIGGLAAGATMLPLPVKWLGRRDAFAFYQSPANKIKLFENKLRGVGPGGIPVAAPDGKRYWKGNTVSPTPLASPDAVADHYSIDIKQYQDQILPTSSGMGPTTLFGYNPTTPLGGGVQPQKHLGGIVVAKRGTPIQVTATNLLPAKHIIPVDKSQPDFPDAFNHETDSTLHLHGGFVPWISDGGPMTAFTSAANGGTYGPSISNGATNLYRILKPDLAAGQGEYYYPNDQSARLMWYHDHAHDTTRLSAYAGVATAYILRDDAEGNLRNQGLPDFIENGGREIPIIIQDKIFVGSNIGLLDPSWNSIVPSAAKAPGSLWYPHIYERTRWRRTYSPKTLPNPSVIPEMFGDTMLVNGTVFPEATVEARRYRLRILNACQARFMNLQFYVNDGTNPNGITLDALGNPTGQTSFAPFTDPVTNNPSVLQIGTEGGFLNNAVYVPTNQTFSFDPNTGAPTGSLLMAPAERSDLIVDFSGLAGQYVVVYTDAPAPFPMGDPRNDYFPKFNTAANPSNALTNNGFGPNTRVLMRFKVISATGADLPLNLNAFSPMPGIDPFIQQSPAVTRQLSLNEGFDTYGRLIQKLGRAQDFGVGLAYMDPSTENPNAGAVEVWEIFNFTGDTHPIHFHLVNVQLLNRQNFNPATFNPANPNASLVGGTISPDPNEVGWKETVRMNPGTVTRVMMQFNLPTTPFTVPDSLNPNLGQTGKEYVWHCHILEHEEHDMMRPLVVV